MLLTTKENVKALLKISSTDEDAVLVALASSVSKELEGYLDRELEIKARTIYFDVEENQSVFSLPAYPITALECWNDTGRTFPAISKVDPSNFTFLGDDGTLKFDAYCGTGLLVSGSRVLKITYTGGLAADQAALQTNFPDLEMAARIQAAFIYKKKDKLGLGAESVGGGSISVADALELQPEVKSILDGYKRYA